MSAFTVVPKGDSRFLAVRVWPGNEEDLENIFGSRLRKSEKPDYDYFLVSGPAQLTEPVSRGDWIVLSPGNSVLRYTNDEFRANFIIMESIFNLEDPTGKESK